MRRRLFAATLALAVTMGGSGVTGVADDASRLRDIYEEARGRVVGITYTLKQMVSEAGVEGPRAEGVLCGVVADASGLIVIPGDVFPEPGGDPRETLVPAEFKIRLGIDETVDVSVVGIDRALNLAFLRAGPDGIAKLKPVRFREAPALTVGERIVVVGVLGRKYGFAPAIFETTVNASVKEPTALFGVDAILQDLTVGGLAVRRDGSAAGLVVKDTLSEDLDQSRSPGNLLAIIANLGQPQVRRPGYAMVLPYAAFASRLTSPPPMDLAADVKRAWIGIVMQPLSEDLRDYWNLPVPGGVIVGAIVDGSPARAAGLKQGDVITKFGTEPIRITQDGQLGEFRRRVELMGVGRDMDLEVYRDGKPVTITVTLAEAPVTASRAEEFEDEEFGLTARAITIDVQQALNLDSDFEGIVIADTEEAGWADIAGIAPDDVVLSVNGVKIRSLAEFRSALEDVRQRRDHEVILFILRPPDTLFVRIKTDFGPPARP